MPRRSRPPPGSAPEGPASFPLCTSRAPRRATFPHDLVRDGSGRSSSRVVRGVAAGRRAVAAPLPRGPRLDELDVGVPDRRCGVRLRSRGAFACTPRRRGSGGSAARGRPPGAWTVACSPFATRSALTACSGPARSACTTSLGRVRRRGPPLALGTATRPGRRSTTTAPTARPPATLAGASAWATGSRIAAPPSAAPAPGGAPAATTRSPARRPRRSPRPCRVAPTGRDDSAGESSEAWSDSTRRSRVALGGRRRRFTSVGRGRPRWCERGQSDGQGGRTSRRGRHRCQRGRPRTGGRMSRAMTHRRHRCRVSWSAGGKGVRSGPSSARVPKRRDPLEPELGGDLVSEKSRRRPTLPGGLPPSTIGAGGLNCRVRNGNGCFPAAMATGNRALGGLKLPSIGASRARGCMMQPLSVPKRARARKRSPSPRPISTGRLNALLHVHLRPINVVV